MVHFTVLFVKNISTLKKKGDIILTTFMFMKQRAVVVIGGGGSPATGGAGADCSPAAEKHSSLVAGRAEQASSSRAPGSSLGAGSRVEGSISAVCSSKMAGSACKTGFRFCRKTK